MLIKIISLARSFQQRSWHKNQWLCIQQLVSACSILLHSSEQTKQFLGFRNLGVRTAFSYIPDLHSDALVKSTPFQNIIKQHHINWRACGASRINTHQVNMSTTPTRNDRVKVLDELLHLFLITLTRAASLTFPSQKGVTWMDMFTETTQNFCWRKGQLLWANKQQQWHLVPTGSAETFPVLHEVHTTTSPGNTAGWPTHLTQILWSKSIYRKWASTRMSWQTDPSTSDSNHSVHCMWQCSHSRGCTVSYKSACEV